MKKRLQLKPKTKLKTRLSVKLTVGVAAFATLVAVAFLAYYNFGTSTDSIAGNENSLSGFNWRKRISIAKDLVKGNSELYNFPVLVSLIDPDLRHVSSGGKMTSKNGNDIRFSKSGGNTLLPFQIEEYNPLTGALNAWVNIDTLRPGVNTELLIYYSNSSVMNTGNTGEITWENGFKGVWHMGSTLNGNNSRKLRATISGTSIVEGKVGKARSFNPESKDYASFEYNEELNKNTDFTVGAWIYLKETGREQVIVSNQGDQPGGYRLFIGNDDQAAIDYISETGKKTLISGNGEKLKKERWYHIAAVYSEKDNKLVTFIDGISDRTFTNDRKPALTAAALQIGRDQFNNKSYFNGYIDELRIAAGERNQAWIATEFYNQFKGKDLLTVYIAEEQEMDAVSIQKNKDAMNDMAAGASAKENAANQLKAKKLGTGTQSPQTVSGSAEVIQARLNNIKRVNEKNSR